MRASCSLSSDSVAVVQALLPLSSRCVPSEAEWNMAKGTEKAKLGSWERFLLAYGK